MLEFLRKKSNIEVHSEPLGAWQDLRSDNIFNLYYGNPDKYSFAFQTYVALTLAKRNLHSSKKPIQVYERSLESVRNIFIKALEKTQSINDSMKFILEEYIDFLNQYFNDEPDLIIYIRTSPSTVLERINDRGRSEERGINKNYLTLLHKLHEAWIGKLQKKGRVFVVDGDLSYEEIEKEYKLCLCAIEQALYNKELDGLLDNITKLKIKSTE